MRIKISYDNSFVDSRHAYLGYVDIREFWIENIYVTGYAKSKVFAPEFTDTEINKIYTMVSLYLGRGNVGYHIEHSRRDFFPCALFVPGDKGKVARDATNGNISKVNELTEGDCVSGSVTVRVYDPKFIGGRTNLAGISVIESSELYMYNFNVNECLHEMSDV